MSGVVALVDLQLPAVAAALYEADKDVLRLRRGAQVDFGREDAEYRPRPGVAALGVGYHLALVYDRAVEAALERELFGRGGEVRVALADVLLLAGGEAAIDAGVEQRLLRLEGQEPERGEVDARARAHEPLEGVVGLAVFVRRCGG